ncbi:MAG: helix-turn-helix domain-containing protein [Streptosporangiaceae bacterium]
MDDFATALHELMTERGVSVREMARRVPCDKALISRYCSGKQRPSLKLAKRCDDLLGAGGDLMALAEPSRRTVLAGGLLMGGLLTIGRGTVEQLTWADQHPRQIDVSAADALADLLAASRRGDDMLGSAVLLRPALAQLGAVENLVREASGQIRRSLLNVAQQWAQFTAWLSLTTADTYGAWTKFAQTLDWAEELGDRTMISTVLAQRAEMAEHAGQVGALIGLAQAAQRDTRAAARVRAYAAGFEARGHAMADNAAAADRVLGEAQDLAEVAAPQTQEWPWLYWMTPGFFRAEGARACAYLSSDPRWHTRAVTLLAPGDDAAPGTWAQAGDLTWLAFAHHRAGEVDPACAAVLQASGPVRAAASVRHARMLVRIHADLAARMPGDARVTELGEALR